MPDAQNPSMLLDALSRLEQFYGPLPAPPSEPFRAYVWEVLSAQTTATRRDLAYNALQRIPALTPDAMFRVPRARLVSAVAHAGAYGEQRLHALMAGVERFRRHPRLGHHVRGPLRQAVRAVSLLPKVGDGAMHRILLFGGGHLIVPVDRDVTRLGTRLMASDPASTVVTGAARRVRRTLEEGLPRDGAVYLRMAVYVKHHAVQTCTDDPHCVVCPLSDSCAGKQR